MARKPSFAFVLLPLLLILVGCAPAALEQKPTIRVGVTQEPDLSLVTVLMALEAMEAKGYPVEITYYAENALNVEALTSGQSDLATGSVSAFWPAIQQGAEIKTIAEFVLNGWVLYATDDIQTCADLNGKRLAVTGEGSSHTTMLRTYIADNCPEIEYELLYIQGGENRAAALLAGEIDAGPIEFADMDVMERESPDGFHAMVTFADELPNLLSSAVHVNGAFAEAHADVTEEFIAEMLHVHEQIIDDSDLLVTAAARILEVDAEEIRPLCEMLIERGNWPVDGGLTEEKLQYSIDYYTAAGDLEAGLTVGDVSDLGYLQAALAK